jgi:hypothetical protein
MPPIASAPAVTQTLYVPSILPETRSTVEPLLRKNKYCRPRHCAHLSQDNPRQTYRIPRLLLPRPGLASLDYANNPPVLDTRQPTQPHTGSDDQSDHHHTRRGSRPVGLRAARVAASVHREKLRYAT